MSAPGRRPICCRAVAAGFFYLSLALVLAGCATPQMSQLQRDFPMGGEQGRLADAGFSTSASVGVGARVEPPLPVRAMLADVPFFAQDA
jgi:hypothetical protein